MYIKEVVNILSIDTEDWYQNNDFNIPVSEWDSYQTRVTQTVPRLLEILKSKDVKATFFVLGYIAERIPELVRSIYKDGHEIASHGYGHKFVYDQTPEEFKDDVKRSIEALERIIGEKVLGYRAPTWTITKKSIWALDILLELGLKYDSSIYPVDLFAYGIKGADKSSHVIRRNEKSFLVEIPPSTLRIFGMDIPFGGGINNRLLPYSIIKAGMKSLNKRNIPVMTYIHPWEIDTGQPKVRLSLFNRKHYIGLKYTEDKFKRLLNDFRFTRISDLLKKRGYFV